MLLEKEYNDLEHEPDNVYSSNSNEEHSTNDLNVSFTKDVSEDNDAKAFDAVSSSSYKSEDETSEKADSEDISYREDSTAENLNESSTSIREKRHWSMHRNRDLFRIPSHNKRYDQGFLYERGKNFSSNFRTIQSMNQKYGNCKFPSYNGVPNFDRRSISTRIGKGYHSLDSDNESLHNELQILGDACENIYNIENRSRGGYENKYSKPLSRDFYHINDPFDYAQSQNRKNLIYYLKEEAIKESERLRNSIYESKSFSQDSNKVKFIRKIKNDKNDFLKDKKIRKINKKRKKIKPIKLEESDTFVEKTTEEMEISENIESFADFSDSMFSFRLKDKIKIFKCPYPGCQKELPSLSRIKRHYLVHTNLKPFKCLNNNCNKRFSRKDNMLQHYRTHCGSKKKKYSF